LVGKRLCIGKRTYAGEFGFWEKNVRDEVLGNDKMDNKTTISLQQSRILSEEKEVR
jgi:hypothetical protein